MPAPDAARIAVLIDADNTSPRHVSALLEELAGYGVVTVKRAYGDWTTSQLGGWKRTLNAHAIAPMQQFSYTTGKNSTDSALIIDAMDLLYSGNLDAFGLVSSDSDFTRLATRLRESGRTVYGLGLRKTPQSLVAACDKFIYLEVLGHDGDDKDEKADDKDDRDDKGEGAGRSGGERSGRGGETDDVEDQSAPLPDLRRILTTAVNRTSGEDGWAHLGSVGQYLSQSHASFDPRNYGFSKLVTLARAQEFLDVEHASGNAPRVRLRPTATTKKTTTTKTTRTAKKTAKKTA